jgi:DNA-binding NtrC family response regulator
MNATILWIVDYYKVRGSLGQTLRREGDDVTLFSKLPEALHALCETGCDVVLIELNLPGHFDWERLVKLVANHPSVSLVMRIGLPDPHQLAAQEGVAIVLEKPLSAPRLLELLGRELAEASELRAPRSMSAHFRSTADLRKSGERICNSIITRPKGRNAISFRKLTRYFQPGGCLAAGPALSRRKRFL